MSCKINVPLANIQVLGSSCKDPLKLSQHQSVMMNSVDKKYSDAVNKIEETDDFHIRIAKSKV